MFGEKDRELKRLEKELLRSDQSTEVPEDEDDGILFNEDLISAETKVPYRNFANGYRAYTNQPSDVNLEEYSEEVRDGGQKSNAPLVALALGLFACILLVLCWWAWRYLGVFE